MKAQNTYSTWVNVDLDAIKGNVRLLLEQAKTPVMAIVKANAYGHGAMPVAKAALEAGASWLGIARADEALELRQAGLNAPTLLLGYTPEERIYEMIENRISLTVWEEGQIEAISTIAAKTKEKAHLHLKVDTGMSRLGVQAKNSERVARKIARAPHLHFEGIFTHFARADEINPKSADVQERLFLDVLAKLDENGIRPPLVHASNSAASLTRPNAHFNLLRFGIAMYGLHPSPECSMPTAFRPALSWKAVLSQVKTLPAGRGVSYGHIYITTKNERIGTIPVGYADGFRRLTELKVLVGGKRVPVIGRVCMDQIMVQLDDVPTAKAGDEVVLIGKQGKAQLSAEDVAADWGTINYEVACAIGPRVPRFYE